VPWLFHNRDTPDRKLECKEYTVAGVFSKYHAFHSGQGTGMDMNPLARGEVPLVTD